MRVRLPVMPTLKSLSVCFESILRQWTDRKGYIKEGHITEAGWLEFSVMNEDDQPENIDTSLINGSSCIDKVVLYGLSWSQLAGIFLKIVKKIDLFEKEQNALAEVVLYPGDGFCFTLIIGKWQSNMRLSDNKKDNKSDALLLIDGMNVLTRCYYATAYGIDEHELLRSSKGVYTNAIKPMTESLLKVIKKYSPTHMAILWESEGGRSTLWRRLEADWYKSNRDPHPEALMQQIDTAKKLFKNMNIKQLQVDGMEADDLASLGKRWAETSNNICYLRSNDKDYYQLLEQNVILLADEGPFTLENFNTKYGGITPLQFIDYKGLCGDSGDNIPGVAGVGHKGAINILLQYGDMETAIIAAEKNEMKQHNHLKRYQEKLLESKDIGLLSKKIARIKTDVPEMLEIPWEELALNISREGYLSYMKELEISNT